MTTSIAVRETPMVLFALRRADDALVLGHRLSEWCGHAPTPEEDIALANMGLDLLGQARSLYAHAAAAEGAGHDEDQFAYLRDPPQYRNLLLLEQPNGDFARTILRQFLYAAFADPWWQAMTRSSDPGLAAIAAKAEKESAYHLRHAAEWVIRLGDGTAESHRRAQEALDLLYPYAGEMFGPADEAELVAAGVAADPVPLRAIWDRTLDEVLGEATLVRPAATWFQQGGRVGRHTEHLGFLLAEMQHLPRTHPGSGVVSLRERAIAAVSSVVDPELPVLTIADLGVLRDVTEQDGAVEVSITPTYSGCPAMNAIALDVELALARAGIAGRVRMVLSPAWTTDWMSEDGRRKLREYGVAPPGRAGGRRALFGEERVECPRCRSAHTERLAEFGSTSCKALWRCLDCREPFDHFRCH